MKKIKDFIKKVKALRGVKIVPLTIKLGNLDNIGIHIFTFTLTSEGKICMFSNARSFMFFSFSVDYKGGGEKLRLSVGALFMRWRIWSKVLKKPMDLCKDCGEYCYTKEFYKDGMPFCSDFCRDYYKEE